MLIVLHGQKMMNFARTKARIGPGRWATHTLKVGWCGGADRTGGALEVADDTNQEAIERELRCARGHRLVRANLTRILTPQNSELYLAALLQEAGLEKLEALRVARREHDPGFGRTSGQQRAILEDEMKSIRDMAATNIEAIARANAEYYYSYVSVDPEESFWRDFQSLET